MSDRRVYPPVEQAWRELIAYCDDPDSGEPAWQTWTVSKVVPNKIVAAIGKDVERREWYRDKFFDVYMLISTGVQRNQKLRTMTSFLDEAPA